MQGKIIDPVAFQFLCILVDKGLPVKIPLPPPMTAVFAWVITGLRAVIAGIFRGVHSTSLHIYVLNYPGRRRRPPAPISQAHRERIHTHVLLEISCASSCFSACSSRPMRYRHRGHLLAVQRRTSVALPQQQSRHLSLIALLRVIRSFILLPPICAGNVADQVRIIHQLFNTGLNARNISRLDPGSERVFRHGQAFRFGSGHGLTDRQYIGHRQLLINPAEDLPEEHPNRLPA